MHLPPPQIILSGLESAADPTVPAYLSLGVPAEFDFTLLDAQHPRVANDRAVLAQVLQARYGEALLRDAQNTGHTTFLGSRILTKRTPEQFAGFALEAYVVRVLNENQRTSRRDAINWASRRSWQLPGLHFTDRYFAIGTGLQETRTAYPHWFNPQDPRFDILFLKSVRRQAIPGTPTLPPYELLTIEGSGQAAGIQVKAITGNEEAEIIRPLLEKKYNCVLTLLQRPNGGPHSREVCSEIIRRMRQQHQIDSEQAYALEWAIRAPEDLRLDQYSITGYYQLAKASALQPSTVLDPVVAEGSDLEVKLDARGDVLLLPPPQVITAASLPPPPGLQ